MHKQLNVIAGKAKENLKAAEICLRNKFYNASANRAYYACLHQATVALLSAEYKFDNNHKDIIRIFNSTLAKEISNHANTMNELFTRRQNADYTDRNTSSSVAEDSYRVAADFINQIEQLERRRCHE